MKKNKAAMLPFSKLSIFQTIVFLDNNSQLSPAFVGNLYVYVNVDQFSKYFVTVPTPKSITHYAVTSLIHHWIPKFFAPQ